MTADVEKLAPIIDWIGDVPIEHGQRDVLPGHPEEWYCLCGVPDYRGCPGRAQDYWNGTGVFGLTVGGPR